MELKKCDLARFKNFLHFLLKSGRIKHTSSLFTYWRNLSQQYIQSTRQRMPPSVLDEIAVVCTPPHLPISIYLAYISVP